MNRKFGCWVLYRHLRQTKKKDDINEVLMNAMQGGKGRG